MSFLPLLQALRDVARDAEDRAEAVDVALNTRIAELEDAKARLIEKDSMVRSTMHSLIALIILRGQVGCYSILYTLPFASTCRPTAASGDSTGGNEHRVAAPSPAGQGVAAAGGAEQTLDPLLQAWC